MGSIEEHISNMVPAYGGYSDEYSKSSPEIYVRDPDTKVGGNARRIGISRPFFKERATYQLPDSPACWVYDNGRFVEVNAWHHDPANIDPEYAE